jgi:hypothetical protein
MNNAPRRPSLSRHNEHTTNISRILPTPSYTFLARAIPVAHACSTAALSAMSRSAAAGGNRITLAKDRTKGAPVMTWGVDLRPIMATALHFPMFRNPSDGDLVIGPPVATDSYCSRRKVRLDVLKEINTTREVLFGGSCADNLHRASLCRCDKLSVLDG